MNALKQTAESILAPQAIAFVCKLSAVCAIACFATVGFSTGFMLNAYVYASRTWVPSRSHYERPLFFEYNATAATAQVTFLDWHQTPEGYHVAPERVEFLRSKDKVNMYVDLTLPESQDNRGLFQLRSTLKSDGGVVLHSTTRPLALPHRSRLVSILRGFTLFPCYLAGLISESITLRNMVAQNFIETPAAPLAAVEVVVTGARPMHVPPIIHSGAITVDVHLSWTQRLLSAARFSPLLHVCIALAATALMFLSSAAALCSCVLCFQTVATFWADTSGAPARGGAGRGAGDAGPLQPALPTADVLREARDEVAAVLRGADVAADRNTEGHAEQGENYGAGSSSSHRHAAICDSPTFKSQVKAAVDKGSAEFHASHGAGAAKRDQHSPTRSTSATHSASMSRLLGPMHEDAADAEVGDASDGDGGSGGGGGPVRRRRPAAGPSSEGTAEAGAKTPRGDESSGEIHRA